MKKSKKLKPADKEQEPIKFEFNISHLKDESEIKIANVSGGLVRPTLGLESCFNSTMNDNLIKENSNDYDYQMSRTHISNTT